MARSIKGITIEIEGKTSGLVKSLNDANKAIRDTESQLRGLNKALKVDPGNADLIKAKQAALAKEIEETKKKLDAEKQAALDAAEALEKGAITQGEYDALQADIVLTTNKLKDLEKEAKNTSSVLGEQMKAAGGKIAEVGDKITGVGEALLPVTGALAGIAAGSLAAFKEVDGAYDKLITKTGAAGDALDSMEGIVEDIATSMPTSFENAADAVGEVNTRFGVTGEELKSLSTQFLKFAEINGSDVSSSIDSVQKGLAAFGLGVEDAGKYLDALNSVGQKTGVNVQQLSSNLVTAAPAFKELGISATQAAEFLGRVETSGADTSAVMTGLRTALKNATADGKSLDTALGEMQTSLQNAGSDAEGLKKAYELFGSKAGAAIYNAVKQGTLSFTDLADAASDSLGSVTDTFDATVDGIDNAQMAINSLKLAGSELGATLGETLAPIIKQVAESIKGFAESWRGLSPELQKTILVIGGVIAALGPVLIFIGKLITAVGTITTAIGAAMPVITGIVAAVGGFMTTVLLPILPIIAAVGLAIAAVITVIKNWSSIVELAGIAWEGLKDIVITVGTAIRDGVSKALTSAGNTIKGVFDRMRQWAENVRTAVTDAMTKLGEGVSSRLKTLGTTISTLVNNAVDVIKKLPSLAVTWGRDMIDSFIEGIKERAKNMTDALRGVAEKVKDFLGFSEPKEGPLSNFHTFAPDMMDLFAKGIDDNTYRVTDALQNAAASTANSFQQDYTGVLSQIALNTGEAKMSSVKPEQINVNVKIGDQKFTRAVVTANKTNNLLTGGR